MTDSKKNFYVGNTLKGAQPIICTNASFFTQIKKAALLYKTKPLTKANKTSHQGKHS